MKDDDDRSLAVVTAAFEGLFAAVGLPAVGGLVAGPALRSLRDEHRRRGSVALRAAVRVSGLGSPEDLLAELETDPRLQPLVVRMLHAASMNGHDRVLQAMGAALGDACRQRADLDECELLLQALEPLTSAHASLLDALARPDNEDAARTWRIADLPELAGLSQNEVSLCLAALVARGLAGEDGNFDGRPVGAHIRPAGWLVLEVLREHARESSTDLP